MFVAFFEVRYKHHYFWYKKAISQMDSSQAQNMPTNVVNSQSTVTLLENDMNTDIPEIFSPLGLRAGTRVNFNLPLCIRLIIFSINCDVSALRRCFSRQR